MRRASLFTLGLMLLMIQPQAANACSFSWKPGHSPADIKERDDARRLEGTFRFIEGRMELDNDGEWGRGVIYGRVDSKSGTHWDTFAPYDRFWVECAAYYRPTADAIGTFWISRRKTDRRYEILLWEGDYVLQKEPGKTQSDAR